MIALTDFHTHILPGVDDGSDSLERSLAMLQKEREHGLRRVVLTPHFYPVQDSPERFLRRRSDAFARLQDAVGEDGPELILGAEVYYFSGIGDCDALSELTIGKKRFMLVEMPFASWTDTMFRDLENLYIKQNIVPIMAHLDRYIRPLSSGKIFRRLESMPVMVQANAEFFTNRSTSNWAMKLLRAGKIHLLGSDCHNTGSRAPNLGPALELIQTRLGESALETIEENEEQVL